MEKVHTSRYTNTNASCDYIVDNSFFVSPEKPKGAPSVFYPIINILALNTIVLILSNAILMRSRKMQTEAELANFKIKHLEAEHQQLIQKLQSHFLFNSISTLKSLIKNDAELAEEYLVKLSNFLRFTISAHENTVISLAEEVQFTSDYIELGYLLLTTYLVLFPITSVDNMGSRIIACSIIR